jgi:hypothetical protein
VVKLCHTESDTSRYLEELLGDDEYRDKLALKGQREVFGKHTYKHRLIKVLDSIGFKPEKDASHGVSVISICHSQDLLQQVLTNFLNQNHARKELIIILLTTAEPVEVSFRDNQFQTRENIHLLQVTPETAPEEMFNQALRLTSFPYISFFSASDYYAPSFLTDLLIAFDYTDADAVGKCSYYSSLGDRLELFHPKTENRYVNHLWSSAMVVKRELLDSLNHQCWSGFDHQYIMDNCFLSDAKLYATDRFNYICRPASLSEADIEQVCV